VKFNDPLYERKPNACAFTARIQFIEQAEDAFVIFVRDADAVITHEENGVSAFGICTALTDLDAIVGVALPNAGS
jgi:hypothetical protein